MRRGSTGIGKKARRLDSASRGSVEHIGPGEKIQQPFEPGDFMLTHSGSLVSRLTQLAQQIRFRGADHKYAFWSHAAVIVSAEGDIVEAVGAGVVRRKLADYARFGPSFTLTHRPKTALRWLDSPSAAWTCDTTC